MMNNSNYIRIGSVILVGVLLSGAAYFLFQNTTTDETAVVTEVPAVPLPPDAAFDVAMEFYTAWLAAIQSTTTDPFQTGLINSPRLSSEVRTMIQEKYTTQVAGDLDPVFCQATKPERVGAKAIFVEDTSAQIMMLIRGLDTKAAHQSVVTLKAVAGMWQITKIECVQGDVAPIREYDFERTGFLLKSVPAPYNGEYWHLVYEENDKPGHVVRLYFTTESKCIADNGIETVCDPSQFVEPTQVLMQADMLDDGARVRRITF